MIYKVTRQYGKAKEIPDKKFPTLDEAKSYIQEHAESDAAMKVASVYRAYDEFDDVVYELDSAKLEPASHSASGDSSAGKSSSATFRPTPLATAPRPKGTPPKWSSDPEEDK